MRRLFCPRLIMLMITACTFLMINLLSNVVFALEKGTPLEFNENEFAPLFPFHIEKGAPNNITNVQTWNGAWKPAGSEGFLKVEKNQFVDQSGPRHFFATNLCFAGNFPVKAKAESVAADLARFGINVVRLHHMDMRDIWGKNFNRTKTEIDPDQLDKLDYLIAQLQKRGIFVNINLHVSRHLDQLDGFAETEKVRDFGKGLDNFEPRMIELQKKYAKDLLTHINPYTKKAYVNDPGVAMIEINNENSVVASWCWGALDDLPECYAKTFRSYWNNWLTEKYPSDAALKKAWRERTDAFGKDLTPEGSFTSKSSFADFTKNWFVLGKENDNFSVNFVKEESLNEYVMKLRIMKLGTDAWIPQFNRQKIIAQKGKLYTVSFKARSQESGKMNSSFAMSHEPWEPLGWSAGIKLTPEWKTYSWTFEATDNDDKTRFALDGFEEGKTYEFAAISFKEGGKIGLPEGVSLKEKNIPCPKHNSGDKFFLTGVPASDWSAFLKYIEEKYWLDMYRYVKEELKAQSPVTGTQLQYGFWYGQGKLDYCDIHAYWNHPNFPHRPWDGNDWLINKAALVNSIISGGATLPRLASVRVLQRPLTVSEYDHPYPNLYCAEGNLMAAAFGAFQNWSVIYQFAWSHSDNYDPQMNTNFFDFCGNQAKLAHQHAAYALFTRGDIKRGPGRFIYSMPMSEQKEIDVMTGSLDGYHRGLSELGLDQTLSLAVCAGIDLTDLDKTGKSTSPQNKIKTISSWKDLPASLGSPKKNWIRNEFKEIFYGFEKNKGYCSVDTSGTKLFTGMIAGRAFDYSGLTIRPGKTRLDWATISIVRTDKKENEKSTAREKLLPGSYLITASGLVMNTGAKIVELPGGKITTAGAYGGNQGTAPVLCEGIPMTFDIKKIPPQNIKVFALDNQGERRAELTPAPQNNGSQITFGPENKTLWYEMIISK